MSTIRYTKSHEWIRIDGDVATIGITEHAQSQLGDVVFVELPEAGRALSAGKEAAVVESVKAASEVYAPVTGTVVEANQAIVDDPALVNRGAEADGWFFKVKLSNPAEFEALLDEASYQKIVEVGVMRYLPLTDAERGDMLARIGVGSVDDLFRDVPRSVWHERPFEGLPPHQGEIEVERSLSAMARKNLTAASAPSFLGAGAYRHHVPAAVDHLIQRGEFLTAYTPYQPEISQGTLQMLFEFQTQVALITGMEVANASLYDGASAAAEAVLMANRVTRRGRTVLSGGLHPHYAETIATYARFGDFAVHQAPADIAGTEDLGALLDAETACVVVQTPDLFGRLHDYSALAATCAAQGILLVIAVAEVVSLGLLKSPGEMGADIVVGEGQSLGNALNFGGPYLGLFATRERMVRQMPGRLAGETVDADGRRGWVLTLSAREQHIRREKATSNICTNSGLCALAFSIHLALLGESGFRRLAELNHAAAAQLADGLAGVPGVEVVNGTFFNEFTVRLPGDASEIVDRLAALGVLGGVPLARLLPDVPEARRLLLVAATELTTESDIAALADGLRGVLR